MDCINTVSVDGKVVHIFNSTENATILKIKTDNNNVVEVVCFNELAIKGISLKIGDSISILGNIQCSNKKDKQVFSIFANSIEKTATLKMKNSFHIKGKVLNIVSRENYTKYFIKTIFNGHSSVFPIVIYKYNADFEFSKIEIGDIIFTAGQIQSEKKIKDFGTFYYQNYVSSAIHKLAQ